MLDLAKLNVAEAAEAGYKMQLVHPVTREPFKGVYITVRGDDSKTVQGWIRGIVTRRQMEEAAARRRGKEAEPMTIAEAEEQAAEGAAKRIIGWENIGRDGKLIEFSFEAAKSLCAENPWIRDQVLEASKDLGNFVKG